MKSLYVKDKNKLQATVIEDILEPAINNRFKSIKAYYDSKKYKIPDQDYQQICTDIEKLIYDQVFYFAHLMYQVMSLSGDWGDAGEQQVKIGFCRNLLKMDVDAPLTHTETLSFMDMIDKNLASLGLTAMSFEDAKSTLKQFKFDIFGTKFRQVDHVALGRILHFCGSTYFLQGGFHGNDPQFILCRGKKTHVSGYDVVYIHKEDIRTPNVIMAMAAVIGHREIYMRMESLKTIFAQKWRHMFHYSDAEKQTIQSEIYHNISEGIKLHTLSLYGAMTEDALNDVREKFIKDMGETILQHELGHGISLYDVLPVEAAAMSEASKVFGENIYTSLLEFLADFAPKKDDIEGPIQNMVTISKTDLNRATRMYFMYLSDTWFFDTTDEYMYIYSELMALVLLKYIKDDLTIDFAQLDADIHYDIENQVSTSKIKMLPRFMALVANDMKKLKQLCESSKFMFNEKAKHYEAIQSYLIDQFKKNDGAVHLETYEFMVPYWSAMFNIILSRGDNKQKIQDLIATQEKEIMKKVLVLSAGKKMAEQFKFNQRAYIVSRMKDLGLMQYQDN